MKIAKSCGKNHQMKLLFPETVQEKEKHRKYNLQIARTESQEESAILYMQTVPNNTCNEIFEDTHMGRTSFFEKLWPRVSVEDLLSIAPGIIGKKFVNLIFQEGTLLQYNAGDTFGNCLVPTSCQMPLKLGEKITNKWF